MWAMWTSSSRTFAALSVSPVFVPCPPLLRPRDDARPGSQTDFENTRKEGGLGCDGKGDRNNWDSTMCDSLSTSDRSVYLGAGVNDKSTHLVTGSLRSFRLDSWSSTGLSGRDIDEGIRDRVVFNLSFNF